MEVTKKIDYLVSSLNSKIENIFIEGLKRKNYAFLSRRELIPFIEKHCRCEDNIVHQEKVYYVNDIPFLIHQYKYEIGPVLEVNRVVTFSASAGSYSFV